MRDFVMKDLDRFLEVSDMVETPFKFFCMTEKGLLRAWVWLRTAFTSWEGIKTEATLIKLREHEFSEAEERETRRIELL